MKFGRIAEACSFAGHAVMTIGAVMIVLDRRGQRPRVGRAGWKVLFCGAIASIGFDLLKLLSRFVE